MPAAAGAHGYAGAPGDEVHDEGVVDAVGVPAEARGGDAEGGEFGEVEGDVLCWGG